MAGKEDGEVAIIEEAKDVEKELVGDDAEDAEARVLGVGEGIAVGQRDHEVKPCSV